MKFINGWVLVLAEFKAGTRQSLVPSGYRRVFMLVMPVLLFVSRTASDHLRTGFSCSEKVKNPLKICNRVPILLSCGREIKCRNHQTVDEG
jgi:hypothetical protein